MWKQLLSERAIFRGKPWICVEILTFYVAASKHRPAWHEYRLPGLNSRAYIADDM